MILLQNECPTTFAPRGKPRAFCCGATRPVDYLHRRRMRVFLKITRQSPLVLIAFLVVAGTVRGQQPAPNWRVYKAADGMPEPACTSVTVGPRGKVWVTHSNASFVSGLDGYTLQNIATLDVGTSRVFESPNGQLWAACAEGLREFRDTNWTLYPVPEIAAHFRTGLAPAPVPVPLYPLPARPGHLPDA